MQVSDQTLHRPSVQMGEFHVLAYFSIAYYGMIHLGFIYILFKTMQFWNEATDHLAELKYYSLIDECKLFSMQDAS